MPSGSGRWALAWRAAAALVAIALLVPAWWHVRTFASIVAARVTYPMDIEWMEGGNLYHAYRVLHGEPIYIDPARGFAPYPYPPLFWVVIAAVGAVVGLDYWTGRAVSILSIAGATAILVVTLVRHAPARWVGALFGAIAAAAIAAGFAVSGGNYDIARPDAFATFTGVVAAALAGDGRISTGRALATAAALTAAIYTKQPNIFLVVWILAFVLARSPRAGLVLLGSTTVLCSLLLVVLTVNTGGWFWTWLFDQRHHEIHWNAWPVAFAQFVYHAPFLVLLPWLVAALRRRRWLRSSTVKWIGMLVAAMIGGTLASIKSYGAYNSFVPEVVLAWPVALLCVCDYLRGAWPRRARALSATWAVACVSSFVLWTLEYPPEPFVPDEAQRRDVEALHAIVRDLDGPAIAAAKPWVAPRDGKACTQPIWQAYEDARAAGIPVDYADAVDRSGARWVVVLGRETGLQDMLAPRYEKVREMDLKIETLAAWDVHHIASLWRRRSE
jgi:hypothetical protein